MNLGQAQFPSALSASSTGTGASHGGSVPRPAETLPRYRLPGSGSRSELGATSMRQSGRRDACPKVGDRRRSDACRLPPRMAARAGSSAGLHACIVWRLGNTGGSRAWQGRSGRPSNWGDRQTPANGCPQRIPYSPTTTDYWRLGG